ncbi:SAM-dependent methyltransferase [Pseudoalteromonas sp. SW0106-04]|uniref:class I SAM-dependent methyltransferase n=1 Tax=Pseudoalteromonas sp. SW0106-04 TaxID=1702169 RepID=UPI0006B55B69|nr:class I SAM-dependent methyltransferase [Pseudoalteromonas sp. SW0106-04]GAP73717.1 SAM-dependent methyltransferase [Pseudoalteromonas sp. SW0106-04]
MPSFQGEEATNYDERISRLVPGYELLHQLTQAQCQAQLSSSASILVVGAGTGKEVVALAKANPNMHFVAQDISADMLAIAEQRFDEAGISARVTCHCGDVGQLQQQFDGALCLLVLHFLADNGDKAALLKSIRQQLAPQAWLWFADLMKPETQFERDAQFIVCQQLGLSDAGVERMRHNLEHEFYPLDRMRLADLLEQCGYGIARCYFKALGFTGYAIRCQS